MSTPILPNVPKFQGASSPAPESVSDWQNFMRWLTQVKTKAGQAWGGQGTHVNRPDPTSAADGGTYFETDRTVIYVAVSGVWTYSAGTMAGLLAAKPGDLAAADTGFLFAATDYAHTYRWNGTGWEFAPGDSGSGFFEDFAIAPGPEWQICDGTATTYAKSDGTTAAFTTPILTGAYRKGGPYTGAMTPAGTITLGGTTGETSAGTPAGTVSDPTLAMDPYTPAGTVAETLTDYTILTGAVPVVTAVGAFTGTPATLTGTVSDPAFTGTPLSPHDHDLSEATATLTGDPVQNLAVPVYFRR